MGSHIPALLSISQAYPSDDLQGTSLLHPSCRIQLLTEYISALTELAQEKVSKFCLELHQALLLKVPGIIIDGSSYACGTILFYECEIRGINTWCQTRHIFVIPYGISVLMWIVTKMLQKNKILSLFVALCTLGLPNWNLVNIKRLSSVATGRQYEKLKQNNLVILASSREQNLILMAEKGYYVEDWTPQQCTSCTIFIVVNKCQLHIWKAFMWFDVHVTILIL